MFASAPIRAVLVLSVASSIQCLVEVPLSRLEYNFAVNTTIENVVYNQIVSSIDCKCGIF